MTQLPEWVATLVGRLVLENEAMRQALIELQKSKDSEENNKNSDLS